MSKGSNKVLAAEIVLQGIGVLISWNAILTALDWYNNRFPNKDPGFWFPLLNFIPAAIFQPLTILYGHKFTFNHRIIPSYIIVALVLGLTPIIVELTSEDLGFIIICILTVFAGMVNAIGQTSVFGLAGTLPNEYTNAVMLGNGLSGLSITCLRLICLGIFTQNSEGYLHSTELYFGISAVVLILCVFAQMHLMKHELVIEGLGKTHSKEGQTPMVAAFNELDSFRDSSGFNVKEKEKVSYPQLFKQIWQYLFLVWINYFITFGVLSHVALATTAE